MFGFIVWELWRFVRHALSARGRRYVYIVLPVSVLLFAGGVGFCCVVTPAAFGFLIRFNVELGVEAQFILSSYLRFFMRLLLVFGLAFQTPLVLWFLVRSAPPPGNRQAPGRCCARGLCPRLLSYARGDCNSAPGGILAPNCAALIFGYSIHLQLARRVRDGLLEGLLGRLTVGRRLISRFPCCSR